MNKLELSNKIIERSNKRDGIPENERGGEEIKGDIHSEVRDKGTQSFNRPTARPLPNEINRRK